ncbi:trypsin-like peptidase domain-containing protein [Glycomyces endophyticus]|uniref:trypsin-like peptidase domain-containing protein n=1 Tax=Glycomyces endophyticus TaxID=480996 RepID=UPI0031E2E663
MGIDDRGLFRFAVRVETGPGDGSGFLGSGFVAAPGLILTCAHVVASAGERRLRIVSELPQVNAATAHVIARIPEGPGPDGLWDRPDLALIELRDDRGRRIGGHPCPRLDLTAAPPPGPARRRAIIAARPNPGNTRSVPRLRGVDFTWESLDDQGFWWLADGHALQGMSGSMLIDPERRAICGVVNNSRGLGAPTGALATPLSELAALGVRLDAVTGFNGASEWDAAFDRRPDSIWRDHWNPGLSGRHFVGREQELADLLAAVEAADGVAVIQSIGGFGGVGKTALAVAFANRFGDRFDGRVFHDFESYRGPVADTGADALGSVLTGIGAATPNEVELLDARARSDRWHAAAADRRLLMVWDNVDDSAQLDGLLVRGSGCVTIVTTRDRLDIADAGDLRLDVLDEGEAIAMFTGLAGGGHPPALVAELVRRDLCVPVLIATHAREIAGGDAALDEIIADLPEPDPSRRQSDPHNQRDLFDRLEGSYRRLDPSERRAFRAFGAHPGALATLGSLAAAMDCDLREAERRMHGLVNAGLAVRDLTRTSRERALRCYRAHDLLRVYGAHVAGAEGDLEAFRLALAQHYLDRLGTGFEEHPDWFEAEVETIEHLSTGGATVEYAHLARFLGYRALRYCAYDAAETGFTQAERIDRARGDQGRTGHSLWGLGEVARLRGELEPAAARYRAALECSEAAGDPGGVGNARRGLAEVVQLRGDAELAERHYTAAMEAYREGGYAHRMIYVERGLGRVAILRGEHRLAAERFMSALAASESEGDSYGIAFALLGIGDAALAAGDEDEAASRFEESKALFDTGGDPVGAANAVQGLGKAALAAGDTALARTRFEEAERVYLEHDAARSLTELKADLVRLEAAELSL